MVASGRLVADGLRRQATAVAPPPEVLADAGAALRFTPAVGTGDGYLVVFSGASAIGQRGLIELADGSWLVEPLWEAANAGGDPDHWRRPCRPRRRQRGPWFSCLLYLSYGYYHWICDVLPRFHRVLERLPAATRFLVPWEMQSWQWDALAAIGIDRARCERLPTDRDWVFDELYYAPPAAMTGDHDPDAIRWVRERVLASLGVAPPPQANDRLFVTRRLARRRRIVNETALWPTWAAAGFQRVEPERMSFADQVRTFSAASVVAGPHGAGLANMSWCSPGARIVEIFSPASADRRCFWTLAWALGHQYTAVIAADAAGPPGAADIECSQRLADLVARRAAADPARPLSPVFC